MRALPLVWRVLCLYQLCGWECLQKTDRDGADLEEQLARLGREHEALLAEQIAVLEERDALLREVAQAREAAEAANRVSLEMVEHMARVPNKITGVDSATSVRLDMEARLGARELDAATACHLH